MEQKGVAAVDRALLILSTFLEHENSSAMTLAELAESTGLYKSTILRLCGSLERAGYLVRQQDGRFCLGRTLLALGAKYQDSFELSSRVQPALQRLVDATGESASFFVREGDTRVCLYRVNSRKHGIVHYIPVGKAFPLNRGASGAIFAAFENPADPASESIRRDLIAVSVENRLLKDTAAIAAPVFDANGLLGTISLAGPTSRFEGDALVHFEREILSTAAGLTSALGGLAADFERRLGLITR